MGIVSKQGRIVVTKRLVLVVTVILVMVGLLLSGVLNSSASVVDPTIANSA